MATRFLFDSSIYITVLRDENFAQEFRPRYIRDIPRTHFSSVVIQELIAGARTFRHRRQAAALYEPFERCWTHRDAESSRLEGGRGCHSHLG